MVSAAIPQLGKTSHYLTEQDVRVDSTYYCDGLLSQLIPEMTALSGGDFISQQDGARSHTPKHTIAYIEDNFPRNADILLPEDWPPHSSDLIPLDYAIWYSQKKSIESKLEMWLICVNDLEQHGQRFLKKKSIGLLRHLGSDFERVSELVGGVLNIKLNEEKVLTW